MIAWGAQSFGGVGVAVAVVLLLGATWLLAEHAARQRIRQINRSLNDWENWSQEHREGVLKRAMLSLSADFALMRRGMMIFTVGVILAGTWAIFTVQGIADDSQDVIDDVCQLSEDFLFVQTTAVTEDIRGRQDDRDDLADQIAAMERQQVSRPTLEDTPGFSQLPPSAVDFVIFTSNRANANARQAISDAKRRLGVFDAQIDRLRTQVDAIRELQRKYECAG